MVGKEATQTTWQTDKWYYAYTFDGETVTVVDASHAQNMHDETK